MSEEALPSAWYPDPDDSTRLRWWDGGAWTEHVQQLPPPPALETEPEADPFIIHTNVPETGTWYAETGNVYVPPAPARVAPTVVKTARVAAPTEPAPDGEVAIGRTWTLSLWLLALLPLIAYGVQYTVWTLGDPNGSVFQENPNFFWIVPVLLVVGGPIVATVDRAGLIARGVKDAPSAFIGIIPPMYFIVRAMNVGAASVATLIVWAVLVLGLYTPAKYLVQWFVMTVA